jgi:MFS transporter, CP family, cyanate transporter
MGEDTAPHPHRWAMLAGVWMVYFCFGSTAAAIAPLVSRITAELDLNHTQMGSILGAWQLVYIGAAIPCGALLDRIGPRRGLALGALVVAISGILRGIATNYVTMLLAVGAFGIGGPLVSVGAPTVIRDWFTGRERGLAMGIYNMGQSLGTIGALSLTSSIGLALAGDDWRLVLIGYGFVALAAALGWFAISSHEASRAHERLRRAEKPAASSAQYLDLLRSPAMRTVLYLAVGTFFFGHALNNWLPEILRVGGMDATSAGLWASIPVVIGMVGALIFPRLAVPERRMKILAVLFLAQLLAPLCIEWGSGTLIVGLILGARHALGGRRAGDDGVERSRRHAHGRRGGHVFHGRRDRRRPRAADDRHALRCNWRFCRRSLFPRGALRLAIAVVVASPIRLALRS